MISSMANQILLTITQTHQNAFNQLIKDTILSFTYKQNQLITKIAHCMYLYLEKYHFAFMY